MTITLAEAKNYLRVSTSDDDALILMPKKKVGSQAPSEEKKKLRVAAYARVSTDNEEQEGSYDIQVKYYTGLIKGNPDWEFAGVYADDGISGTYTAKRGGFMQMINDCRERKIDKIITKSISRFARNTVDCLNYTRELKELNIAVQFEKENINTLDASGEVMLTIMAAMAQQESESLSQNVRLGIKFRNEQGKVQVNHNWFLGYTKDEEGNLIIDEEQAEVVRRIYRDFLDGKTERQIVIALEAEGIKNGAGHTKWQKSNIHQILTNEKYIGDALLQKTYTYNTLEKKRRKNRTDAPQYYVADNHEPIVARETFLAVQKEMARRADLVGDNLRRRIYNGKYAFSSVIFCGYCGDILTRKSWYPNPDSGAVPVWTCATRLEKGPKVCGLRYIYEEKLQALTVQAINMAIDSHNVSTDIAEECTSEALSISQDEQIAELETKIRQLQDALLFLKAGSDEIDDLGNKIIRLRDKKNALLEEKALASQRASEIRKCIADIEGMSGPLENFDEGYVRKLITRINLFDDHLDFIFKNGQIITINE